MPYSQRLLPLKDVSFTDPRAKQLWISIFESEDSFAKRRVVNPQTALGLVDKYVNNSQNWLWTLNAGPSWPSQFMPIRSFRTPSPRLPVADKLVRNFLSSGTSSGPTGRSKSGFSKDGLALYKCASLKSFADLLKKVSNQPDVGGVSLVPSVESWPDSSLAQMVEWIGEFWDVEYANYLNPANVEAAIAKSSQNGSRPVFIFGTAFHFIDFLDSSKKLKLPPGSIVVETGGTKGRTRSVTRSELYELISGGFAITEDAIVSEYGMCELASQAYDFVPFGSHRKLSERSFLFPWWSPIAAMSEPTRASNYGEGALVIWDRARIDAPAPIQTEDIIQLNADGSFQLLGRVPTAPLKGCSLKVDELVSPDGPPFLESTVNVPTQKLDFDRLLDNAKRVMNWLQILTEDKVFQERLGVELGSPTLAFEAISDLKLGMPTDPYELSQAAIRALNGKQEISRAWLVISPSTHSFATIQGLALLLTHGVKIRFRMNTILGQQGRSSSLSRMLDLVKDQTFYIEIVPQSWKISSPKDLNGESILVYGGDETIAEIKRISGHPVIGLGNKISATIVTAVDLESMDVIKHLARDNAALAQRGCMSARINFVVGKISQTSLANLCKYFRNYRTKILPKTSPQSIARSMEVVRLQQAGANLIHHDYSGWQLTSTSNHESLAELISNQELSYLFSDLWTIDLLFSSIFFQDLSVGKYGVSPTVWRELQSRGLQELGSTEIVRLGTLNAPKLNGCHFGRPFFDGSIRL